MCPQGVGTLGEVLHGQPACAVSSWYLCHLAVLVERGENEVPVPSCFWRGQDSEVTHRLRFSERCA